MSNSSNFSYSMAGPLQVVTSMFLCPIIAGVIFGNGLVIVSVAHYKKLQTFTNMLLVSLATSDLLVGLLVMPFAYLYLIEGKWRFGQVYCHIWATIDVLLCTASILNLCAISIDRYCALSWPLKYIRKRNDYLAAGVITIVWSVSIVICAPPWFNIPGWSFHPSSDQCYYVRTLSYRIYSACGSFFIPLIIMITVYSRILKITTNREKALNVANRKGSQFFKMHRGKPRPKSALLALDTTAMAISGFVGSRKTDARGSRTIERTESSAPTLAVIDREESMISYAETEIGSGIPSPERQPGMKSVGFLAHTARNYYEKTIPTALLHKATEYYANSKTVKPTKEKSLFLKERKALKTIGFVVVGFVLCWFPFFVLYILQSACGECGIPQVVESIFLWTGYTNSVLNPFIYAAYNRDFRRCFRDILTGGCFKKKTRKTMSVRRLHQHRI